MQTLKMAIRTMAGMVVCIIACSALAQTPPPAPATAPAAPAPAATGKSLAASAGVLAYPAKAQTPEQQTKDEAECYNWAKTQTNYDPMSPPPATAEPAQAPAEPAGPDGSRAKGALRGAAAGAVIGEVADNDAGKGAAIGATTGVVAGGRQSRKAEAEKQQQAQQQAQASTTQAKAAQDERANEFKNGMSLCLGSRGYNVK